MLSQLSSYIFVFDSLRLGSTQSPSLLIRIEGASNLRKFSCGIKTPGYGEPIAAAGSAACAQWRVERRQGGREEGWERGREEGGGFGAFVSVIRRSFTCKGEG